MRQVQNQFRVEPPDELGQVVRTDVTGNVDISLVEYCLSLTPAQRVEQNYQARKFIGRIRGAAVAADVRNGTTASDLAASE